MKNPPCPASCRLPIWRRSSSSSSSSFQEKKGTERNAPGGSTNWARSSGGPTVAVVIGMNSLVFGRSGDDRRDFPRFRAESIVVVSSWGSRSPRKHDGEGSLGGGRR